MTTIDDSAEPVRSLVTSEVAHEVTVSAERLVVGTQHAVAGTVRAHKRVDTEHVTQTVELTRDTAELERVAAREDDSGQVETMADGSLSIPLLEERVVVEKQVVLVGRVVLRKHTVTVDQTVEADLRSEHVEIETDPGLESRVSEGRRPT